MSHDPQDRRPDPTEEPGEVDATQELDATGTREFDATDAALPEPAGYDDPLSVFDQPSAAPAPADAASSTAAPSDSTAGTGSPSYADTAYAGTSYAGTQDPGTPHVSAPYGQPAGPATGYGATAPGYAPDAWAGPPPKPLVKTTPRTATIVWGFIILAIGVGVISVAAGATLDVGLALIWLLAAAGAVLIAASVLGAVRRRTRAEGSSGRG